MTLDRREMGKEKALERVREGERGGQRLGP